MKLMLSIYHHNVMMHVQFHVRMSSGVKKVRQARNQQHQIVGAGVGLWGGSVTCLYIYIVNRLCLSE